MRSVVFLCLSVVLCLTAVPVSAFDGRSSEPSAEELVALESQLQAMLGQLTGLENAHPVFSRQRKNLYSLTLELSDHENRMLARSLSLTKGPQVLAVGQQGTIPSNPTRVSNAVLFGSKAILSFWWAVYNPGADDIVRNTRLTVKGSGRLFVGLEEELNYQAGTITLHWEGKNVRLEKPGVYTHRVRIDDVGKRKAHFVVRQVN